MAYTTEQLDRMAANGYADGEGGCVGYLRLLAAQATGELGDLRYGPCSEAPDWSCICPAKHNGQKAARRAAEVLNLVHYRACVTWEATLTGFNDITLIGTDRFGREQLLYTPEAVTIARAIVLGTYEGAWHLHEIPPQ